jgi:gamma-glutamylcyclotransferase (GGCT)/AIG2-like uncharacterized protein YtfP
VPEAQRAIDDALYSHLNRALRRTDPLASCEGRFLALNVLFSAHDDWTGERDAAGSRSQHRSLQRLLTSGLPSEDRWTLIDHETVARLAELRPTVLDHDKLGRFRLSDDIPDDVRERAAQQHTTLVRRLERLSCRRNGRNRDKALESLADLLWMVRSNLAHGEKTGTGPDPQRNERNRTVAYLVLPVLDAVLDTVLGRPSMALVVYGTLSPGEANESVLAGVEGTWEPVRLEGTQWTDEYGLPRFRWEPMTGTQTSAKLLRSAMLPQHWSRLDQFEGNTYRRILVRYSTTSGFGVANCFQSSA